MRLTTRTNLAARVLMFCAVNDGRLVRSSQIAEGCNASLNHVAHVVNVLNGNGYVETTRGRSGGLQLAQEQDQISIGTVFRLFEEAIPLAECFDEEQNTCPLSTTCRLRNYVQRALDAFYHELDMVTLADLVKGNCGLSGLLEMREAIAPTCLATAKGAA